MSYLIRRTNKALAGWEDKLTGKAAPVMDQPWRPWGDPRTVSRSTRGMVLGNDGGWFQPEANGGMGYEFQPLTRNWEIEFKRELSSYTQDGEFRVYLDKNWTAGNGAGTTRYQTYLSLEHSTKKEEEDDGTVTTTVTRYMRLNLRDTNGFIFFQGAGGDAYSLSKAQWDNGFSVKIRVYRDSLIIGWVDGIRALFYDITDPKYNFTGGGRSGNFAQIRGPVNTVSNFLTRDVQGLPSNKFQIFYDDFNRGNGPLGNGWSQAGSDFGINKEAMSMQEPFLAPSAGHRFAWQSRQTNTRDQRIEVTYGGGTGDPTDASPSYIIMRANSSFTRGFAFRIQRQEIAFGTVDLNSGNTSVTWNQLWYHKTPDIMFNGHKFAFNIAGDMAWVDRIDGGRQQCVFWCDRLDTLMPATNRSFGAIIARSLFINSVPFNDFRVFDIS